MSPIINTLKKKILLKEKLLCRLEANIFENGGHFLEK